MTTQVIHQDKSRIDWVDYAKGVCIILVVMMHSTLGVEKAMGELSWMNGFVEWARPFRMPDFFFISGLFLASRIDRPWRTYLDTKVLHFAYFYVLWMTIQFGLKSGGLVADLGAVEMLKLYGMKLIEPFGTLWFIYMLPIFFVVAKGLKRWIPPLTIWLMAAFFEMGDVNTGWTLIDEFAGRFVYFYSGYVLAPHVFAFADKVREAGHIKLFCGLFIWAMVNGYLVLEGYATMPVVSLALGLAGTAAIVVLATILARVDLLKAVRYCGQNSIVIYLAFFLFMAATRMVLLKTGIITDGGTIALIVTAAGVVGPIVMLWMVRRTPAKFLFVRPEMFKLKAATPAAAAPAQVVAAE